MKILTRILTFAVLAAATSAGADPLLRENWTGQESRRARGVISAVGEIIESPRNRWTIEDRRERKFEIDRHGEIAFNPLGPSGLYDANWLPVLPDSREAPLYNSEAEALYGRGLKEEALRIWKALRSMTVALPRANAAVRRAAREATARLNHLAERDASFAAVDLRSDPYAFFDDERGRTIVLSDRHGFRLELPGAWKFAADHHLRGHVRKNTLTSPGDHRPPEERDNPDVVHLGHADWIVTIGADHGQYHPELPDYVRLWDRRRTLTAQRKRLLAFQRTLSDQHADFCDTRADAQGRLSFDRRAGDPENGRFCGLLRSELRDRDRRFYFYEYYVLRGRRGLYIEFRPGGPEVPGADGAWWKIMESLKLRAGDV